MKRAFPAKILADLPFFDGFMRSLPLGYIAQGEPDRKPRNLTTGSWRAKVGGALCACPGATRRTRDSCGMKHETVQ